MHMVALAGSVLFHNKAPWIGPSVLAADLSRLAEESNRVLACGADFLHLDVMDGHFVPNISFGAPVIKSLRSNTEGFFDAHLMVTDPLEWVDDMAAAGVQRLTFHVEVADDVTPIITKIKDRGMKVGLSLRPGTPVESLFQYMHLLDVVLVMTVEPGFGGQKFMPEMMEKVSILRQRYPELDIEVDGGLSTETIDAAAKAGANQIVAGSAVFKAADPCQVITTLRRSIEKYGNGKADSELTPLP